ncbi:putative DMT superfamily transporter inner membrane protein [Clostridium tepidiprofundi DSM 19306]|uniref:Putative DMT superfamily transporter inner membrane protein n=1 Tax=Clostridium tepidiprofundi DSM 19306 TaxID=1121338 RepID=A0A151B5D6_9CLOT|nr:DMT family transporter [Clostridium tepidiprofundi]KYH35115.1 putative DMT superfamily transporter inner membrane protein [Clostridium tepidiprofundi DSM 19306]
MDRSIKGIFYIILSAVAFGIMPILAKIAYIYGSNSVSVLFFRFAFASIMLLAYIKYKNFSLKLNKKQIILILILGLIGYTGCSIIIFTSYNYISVGLATMILYIHPAIVVIFTALFCNENITLRKIVSLIMTLVGLVILVDIKGCHLNLFGILLAFISAICYSIYVIGISNKEFEKLNSYVMTFYFSILSASAMFVLGLISNDLNIRMSLVSLICILVLAFISTIIALMTFLEGVKLIGPSNATILSTLEPVVSLVLGAIILKEVITFKIIIGSVLILSAVIVLIRGKR